jgi:hypothetical protein
MLLAHPQFVMARLDLAIHPARVHAPIDFF